MKHLFSLAMALGLTIGALAQSLVVFQVDMNDYSGTYGQVNLNGGFNGWCGGCAAMTDDDGDNVYQLEVDLAPGIYEYKFTLDGWSQQEMFEDGDVCTSAFHKNVVADRFAPVRERGPACPSERVAPCSGASSPRRRPLAVPQQGLRRRPRAALLRSGVCHGVQPFQQGRARGHRGAAPTGSEA